MMVFRLSFVLCATFIASAAITTDARADSLSPGTIIQDCPTCPEMVVIPAGSAKIGVVGFDRVLTYPSDGPIKAFHGGKIVVKETPVYRVTIANPFAMGRFEITIGEYEECVKDGICESVNYDFMEYHRIATDRHPRDMVGWGDAIKFAQWLSRKTSKRYRLPSEAEWEYAARGGTDSLYWWGYKIGVGRANCKGCGPGSKFKNPQIGGTYAANPFGLYDVLGNLSEWVMDCWNASHYGAPKSGVARLTGNCSLRVIKGGGAHTRPQYLRVSKRYRISKGTAGSGFGIRLLRELD